jgi:hypothetical protein
MRAWILSALLCLATLAGCGGDARPKPNPTRPATTTPDATSAPQGVVLGEHGFVNGRRGWGSPHPVQIDVGGDPALVIQKIRWRGWGSRHAQGVGIAPAFNLDGGSWDKRVRVELQAYELGRCEKSGPRAYRNLRLRMPPRPGAPMGQWFVLGGAHGLCRDG